MEYAHSDNSQDLLNHKYYPLSDSNYLHPLLDNQDLLYEFYKSSNRKAKVKSFCKKHLRKVNCITSRVIDEGKLKSLILLITSSSEYRKKLNKYDASLSLYQVVFLWTKVNHPQLFKSIDKYLTQHSNDKRYLKRCDFLKALNDGDIISYEKDSASFYLLLSFAMLQPEDSKYFISHLITYFPKVIKSISYDNIDINHEHNSGEPDLLDGSVEQSYKSVEDKSKEPFLNSIEDIIQLKANIVSTLDELNKINKHYYEGISSVSKLQSPLLFTKNSALDDNILLISENRRELKLKYCELMGFLDVNCNEKHEHECSVNRFNYLNLDGLNSFREFNECVKSLVDEIGDLIELTRDSHKEVKSLKITEKLLRDNAKLSNPYFVHGLYNKSPCSVIKELKDFQSYISKLRNDSVSIVSKKAIEIKLKLEDIIEKETLSPIHSNLKLKLEDLISRVGIADNLDALYRLEEEADKTTQPTGHGLSKLSNTMMKKSEFGEGFEIEDIFSICEHLNRENLFIISFLIMQSIQVEDDIKLGSMLYEDSIDIYIKTIGNISHNEIETSLLMRAFCHSSLISNLDKEHVSSLDMIERLVVLTTAVAIYIDDRKSSEIFLKLNAMSLGKGSLDDLLFEIVSNNICNKEIVISKSQVEEEKKKLVSEINGKIFFEDGKYRHIQKNAKHYSRFETLCVYPALSSLWENISSKLDNKEYEASASCLERIDSNEWYKKLEDEYSKPLINHEHYSSVTLGTIESFVCLLKRYVYFLIENMPKDQMFIDEGEYKKTLIKWSDNVPLRSEIVNKISDFFTNEINVTSTDNFWDRFSINPVIVSYCPQFVVWLSGQVNPKFTSEVVKLIVCDLALDHSYETAKDILEKGRAWKSLSILYKDIDLKASEEYSRRCGRSSDKLSDRFEKLTEKLDIETSFKRCLKYGHSLAAEKLLEKCENYEKEKLECQKEDVKKFTDFQLEKISQIKDISACSNMSELWIDSVYQLCSKIEIRLRQLKNITDENLNENETHNLQEAIVTLISLVKSSSKDFGEVKYHLSLESNDIGEGNTDDYSKSKESCPDLIECWHALSQDGTEDKELRRTWGEFVKEFAKISNLYHDRQDERKRFGIIPNKTINYTYPVYQTAFYKPKSEFLKRSVRLYLYRNDVDITNLKRLDQELLTEDSAARLHIIFVPQSSDKIRRYFKYDIGFKNFLLIDEMLLIKICCSDKHEVPIRQALHASVIDLANSSPFVAQGYCHQANNIYVGRKDILQKLLNNPQAMIWGGRRIGKTSVLHALESALNRRNYKAAYVYVDIQDDGDPDLAIAKKIALTLGIGNIGSISDFSSKISELRRAGTKVAFLIDEVDEYIKKSRSVHGSGFPLATALRQLVMADERKDTFLVYSGYHQLFYEAKLDQEKRRVGHPFINIAQEVPIRDLTYDDVAELVKTGFQEMLGIEVNPKVPRLIADRASRHPAFVQQFCRCLLERVSHRRSPKTKVTVTTNDVEAIYSANVSKEGGEQAFIFYVNETLGYNLSHLGRSVMLTLTDLVGNEGFNKEAYFTAKRVFERLADWCHVIGIASPDKIHFQQTIDLLVMTNMLTQDNTDHNRYKATYPTYLDILNRLDKIGHSAIEDSLTKYDEKERAKGILL